MAIKVMIVDDSLFFRKRLITLFNDYDDIDVVAQAKDGQEAVDLCLRHKPDVITMDVNMPKMDGIMAVTQIMQQCPTPILMFSALTKQGADETLRSLEAGAVDFFPKQMNDMFSAGSPTRDIMIKKIKTLAASNCSALVTKIRTPEPIVAQVTTPLPYDHIVIGSSTGGPVVLQTLLKVLPTQFSVPMTIVQHMPASFTENFADRLNNVCHQTVRLAKTGDRLTAGTILIAPGGKQLEFLGQEGKLWVSEGSDAHMYNPSINHFLDSIHPEHAKRLLIIILTGMGVDGRDGAKRLKSHGAHVWAQSKESCVINGMPGAVVSAGVVDHIYDIQALQQALLGQVA